MLASVSKANFCATLSVLSLQGFFSLGAELTLMNWGSKETQPSLNKANKQCNNSVGTL